jgi:type II secretory pathway predicted ATPase ExeA
MYCEFFGLGERPFELNTNPKFLVLTPGHREALSVLEYGIASRKGITLLLGEAGTGKTTIIRTAVERQPHRVHCEHLHNPSLTRDEFLEMLAARFELSAEARRSKTVLLLELDELLRARKARGESTVLIVDEAQSIPLELLEELRLLVNMETDDTKLMSLVLVGQPELAERLNDPALRQLKQRIALRSELRPLSMAETLGCIAGRIRAAGGIGAKVFSRDAVTLVHERSKGIPRTACVIADNALVTAFALRQKPVTARIVEEVCRDLDLVPATATTATTEVAPAAAAEPKRPASMLTFESSDVDGATVRSADAASAEPAGISAAGARPAELTERVGAPEPQAEGLFANLARRRRRFQLF